MQVNIKHNIPLCIEAEAILITLQNGKKFVISEAESDDLSACEGIRVRRMDGTSLLTVNISADCSELG